METSHIFLNHGLTFLVVATTLMFLVVGVFFVLFLINLTKLTKNLDETTTIVKSEIEPTLQEFHDVLQSVNSIAKNADKRVDSISKFFEEFLGAGGVVFSRAKQFSGGVIKGLTKGLVTVIKMFINKK